MSQIKNNTRLKDKNSQSVESYCEAGKLKDPHLMLFLAQLALLQSFSESMGLVNTSQYLDLALESAHEETSSLKSSN
jgi:hypothetical protein